MDEPIRVLLVDDELSFLVNTKGFLTGHGFDVETAASGSEALELAKKSQCSFQVAVIDQLMGPPNGTEIMVAIRQVCPAIEAIILTGKEDMAPGEKAMELGAYRYMSKQPNEDELVLNIRTAARLGRERKRRAALEALVSAGCRIGTAQTEEELYQMLDEEAGKLLPGMSAFLISSFDEQMAVVSFRYARRGAEQLSLPPRQGRNGITEWVLRQGKPLLLPTGDEPFRKQEGLDPPDPQLGHCACEVTAPMFLKGRVVGAINALSFEQGVHYTREQEQVLQAFANQAAVEIRNVLQRIEAEQLREATEALAQVHGRENVLRAIVERAHSLIESNFTGLILQELDGTLHKIRPVIPEEYFDRFDEPRQEGGVTRWVVENRARRIINNTQDDPLVKDSVREEGIRSMLAFPLMHLDRVLGVLYAHTFEHRYFRKHDVDLWQAFATQAAGILAEATEHEREIEDARRLAEEIGSLADRVDMEETMRRVAGAAKVLLHADTCRLLYVDPPTKRIMDSIWADGDPLELRNVDEARPPGAIHSVLGTLRPLFAPSAGVAESPGPKHEMQDLDSRWTATLPLIHGTRAIAVAQCTYMTRQDSFDEHTQTLFEALAGRAAVALDGARRDHLDEIWNNLDRAVAECTDLKDLYRLFATHAQEALHADFAVLYPYDPTVPPGRSGLKEEDAVPVGNLQTPWEPPKGGHEGGVHGEIEKCADGVLIVNDLGAQGGRLTSRLSEREKVKAFVGLRLDVSPPGEAMPQIAGMLFLNYRQVTAFERADLADLQRAGTLVAASIRRLNLREQRFRQQHAIVEIFDAFRARQYSDVMLTRVAQAVKDALDVDTCTVHEYDQSEGVFISRGGAGLEAPEASWSVPEGFKTWFLEKRKPSVIYDAPKDERMEASAFVARERIQSLVVCPLHVDDEPMGLLFGSFRHRKVPTSDELEAIMLFANIAAFVLHEARLRGELGDVQDRLRRRMFLDWVSMIETTWRHSLCRKAAAIRNYAGALQIRLERYGQLPQPMEGVEDAIEHIDRLAAEIAAAPPRVPQSWEMEPEFFPLGPLLEEVVVREGRVAELRGAPTIEVTAETTCLAGVQILGYRRWLIYALEALLQNARGAISGGGAIQISGLRAGSWAEVRIQDTGSGVPEAVQAKLFNELVPRELDKTGMGIGALLAAIIVEEHGGVISLEKPGPGDTTVLLRLPEARRTES